MRSGCAWYDCESFRRGLKTTYFRYLSSAGQTARQALIKDMVLEHAAGRMKNTSDIRAPDLTASRITALPLREHAADALRRARKLPIGPDRNDLRQLAVGLKWLEKNGRTA